MKLKVYLEALNKLAHENPSALEYDIVTAKDDEGNGFNPVNYFPQLGVIDADGDFGETRHDIASAVCLN